MFSDYKPYTRYSTNYFMYMTSFNPHHFLLLIPFCWWGNWATDSLSLFPKSDKFNRSELRVFIFCALDFTSRLPNRSEALDHLQYWKNIGWNCQTRYKYSQQSPYGTYTRGHWKRAILLTGEVNSVIFSTPNHHHPQTHPVGATEH